MCLCYFNDRLFEVPAFKLKSIHVLSLHSTSSSNVFDRQCRHYEKPASSASASSKKGTSGSSAPKSIATKSSTKTPTRQKPSPATSSSTKKGSSSKARDKSAVNVRDSPLVTSSSKVQLPSSSRKSPRKRGGSPTPVSEVLRFSSFRYFVITSFLFRLLAFYKASSS